MPIPLFWRRYVNRSEPLLADALILRLTDFGETDRIVTMLTPSHGKLSALAKGARTSRRRFGASLSLFHQGHATLRERKGHDLWGLDDFHVLQGHSALFCEVGRFAHASYATELVREVCPPATPEPMVFATLTQFLATLSAWPLDIPLRPEPLLQFEWSVWRAVGFELLLEHCVACQRQEAPTWWLDIGQGGVWCAHCHAGHSAAGLYELSPAQLHALQQLRLTSTLPENPVFSHDVLRLSRQILLDVTLHHLGKPLKSTDVIRQLQHNPV